MESWLVPMLKWGGRCKILQQVTIGTDQFKDDFKAPKIGHNCFIGAGAKLIGPIEIGSNVVIGANTVVTKSIPDNAVVVGVNRILSRN